MVFPLAFGKKNCFCIAKTQRVIRKGTSTFDDRQKDRPTKKAIMEKPLKKYFFGVHLSF